MRPIDADKMKSYIDCGHLRHPDEICLSEHNVVQMLDKQPTLDVEPVRHGRWEYKFYPTVWYGPGEPPEWICSVCQDRSYNTYDFCPNCGAKMDAKEEYE